VNEPPHGGKVIGKLIIKFCRGKDG
jgi:hypothetical protein